MHVFRHERIFTLDACSTKFDLKMVRASLASYRFARSYNSLLVQVVLDVNPFCGPKHGKSPLIYAQTPFKLSATPVDMVQ
jgi:hypothetical protein